jgi:hypothetical protein
MEGDKLSAGQEHVVVETVTIHNYVMPTFWHRIDIVEALTIRVAERRKPVKSWTKKSCKAAYAWEIRRYLRSRQQIIGLRIGTSSSNSSTGQRREKAPAGGWMAKARSSR